MHVPEGLDTSKWMSDVSNDNSFFEYSVAIDHSTANAELRFLIEAQPEGTVSKVDALTKLQESAVQLNERIAEAYGPTVSFERMKTLQDIFMPPRAEGNLAAWHSCAMTKSGPQWKIYLNPNASGSNTARSATQSAFSRLGLASAWELLASALSASDIIQYFSLDLSGDTGNSRVKVYVAHPNASSSEIAEKHVKICPTACAYSVQQFCASMAGGSLGPYNAKPVLSCFAFTTKTPEEPVGTVHFPVVAYADNDSIIEQRVEAYISATGLSREFRARYKRVIKAVERRPMEQGRGIQAWVSLKLDKSGRRATTFYLSPELFGPLA